MLKLRYSSGIEVLTGLAIGAAMVGSIVSLLITILVLNEARIEDEMGTARLTATASELLAGASAETPAPDLARLFLLSHPEVAGAALLDGDGRVVRGITGVMPGPDVCSGLAGASGDGPVLLDSEEDHQWSLHPVPGSDLLLALALWRTGSSSTGFWMVYLLGGICAGLVVLAFATPRFLDQRVLKPLRDLLREADRAVEGGGRTADTARASFRQLVGSLADRDRELNDLRRVAEERADAAEAMAGSILESMKSGILAVDSDSRVLYFNHRAAELLGLDSPDRGERFPSERSDLLSETWSRVLHPAISGEEEPDSVELIGPDEESFLSMTAARSSSTEVSILITDVTRIRQLERRLADEEAFSRLGIMATGISHEMGNTLCALSGFMDLLARGHADERTASILAEARSEVESAQRMIGAFKSYARPWKLDSGLFGIRRLRSVARDVCARWPERCRLADGPDIPGEVQADPVAFATCLENIVRNSLEASPDSSVEIRLEAEDEEYVVVEVSDDGPGLPADLDTLCRPFYTTHPEDGNTGMGLAIARRLTEAMGGHVEARNRKDNASGAIFRFVLPMIRPDEAGGAVENRRSEERDERSAR